MEMIVWLLAGAVVGWVSFTFFKYSEGRGMFVSLVIGATGALIGGHLLAPAVGAAAAVAGTFSAAAFFVALASAGALLFVGDRIHDRFGV